MQVIKESCLFSTPSTPNTYNLRRGSCHGQPCTIYAQPKTRILPRTTLHHLRTTEDEDPATDNLAPFTNNRRRGSCHGQPCTKAQTKTCNQSGFSISHTVEIREILTSEKTSNCTYEATLISTSLRLLHFGQ